MDINDDEFKFLISGCLRSIGNSNLNFEVFSDLLHRRKNDISKDNIKSILKYLPNLKSEEKRELIANIFGKTSIKGTSITDDGTCWVNGCNNVVYLGPRYISGNEKYCPYHKKMKNMYGDFLSKRDDQLSKHYEQKKMERDAIKNDMLKLKLRDIINSIYLNKKKSYDDIRTFTSDCYLLKDGWNKGVEIGSRYFSNYREIIYNYYKEAIPKDMYIVTTCMTKDCGNPRHLIPVDTEVYSYLKRELNPTTGFNKPCKVTVDEVRAIRNDNSTNDEIGYRYNISGAMVTNIKNKKSYYWVRDRPLPYSIL